MKLLRLVIFFVLSLALPSLGLAGVVTTSPCPMQAASPAALAMDMAQMDCAGADSADSGVKLKSHGSCKMEASCHACSSFPLTVALNSVKPLPTSTVIPTSLNTPIFFHDPEGLWRPPQR